MSQATPSGEPEPSGRPEPSIEQPIYGVDTMLFVYHFEANPEFGPAAGRILGAAEKGRCRLVTSVLSLLEALVVPNRTGAKELCRRYRDFFESFPNLETLPLDIPIAELASGLRAAHTVRMPDAIHLATALSAGVQGFLTEDRRLPGLPKLPVLRLEEAADRITS